MTKANGRYKWSLCWIILFADCGVLYAQAETEIAEPRSALVGHVETWRAFVKNPVWNCMIVTDVRDGQTWHRNFWRGSGYAILKAEYTEDDMRKEMVRMVNPLYSASILRPKGGEWQIVDVHRLGPTDMEEIVREGDPYELPLAMGANLFFKAVPEGPFKITRAVEYEENDDLIREFKVEFDESDWNTKVPPVYSRLLRLSRNHGYFPIRTETDWQHTTNVQQFDDWRQYEGVWLWGKSVMISKLKSSPQPVRLERSVDLDRMNERPKKKETYLSHYGFPEPYENPRKFPLYWLIVGAGCVFIVVGLIIRRRQSNA